MGDAFTDQAQAARDWDEFEDRVPDIERMIKHTPFDKMTDEQHSDANAYYKYKLMELRTMLCEMADAKYMWEIRRHFDAELHQGKYKDKK